MLSIDGTFLLGKYMATLLVAISCDVDNALVPLAFALVEREQRQLGLVHAPYSDTYHWPS